MACEGKKSGTVQFNFVDGTKLNVVSQKPGISVTMTPVTTEGESTIHLIGTAYAAGCVVLENHDEVYGTADATTTLSLVAIDNNSCPNGAYYQIPGVSSGNGTVWLKGSVSLFKDGSKNGCKITVNDTTGKIFTKTVNQACPNYKVSCDDECPDGYCKIDCEAYPGYCCLNEAEIKSLSNQLR